MKQICIIHPEGNINNNPNLSGIVEILCEQGYRVDVFSRKRPEIYQFSPCVNSSLHLEDYSDLENRVQIAQTIVQTPYNLIIGIDDGIMQASIMAGLRKIPYGLISYELSFADEVGIEGKKNEIEACRELAFAVVQDKFRGEHLCRENQISKTKLVYIPVAGRGKVTCKKQDYWHKRFNLPSGSKVALYMGSLYPGNLTDQLILHASKMNSDWCLVIHSRYGKYQLPQTYVNQIASSERIYLSDKAFEDFNQLGEAICSADIGLLFYKPIEGNAYSGKNVQYIGLSSGKFSKYMQYGLPVICNRTGYLSDFISEKNVGLIIENMDEIGAALVKLPKSTINFSSNAKKIFEEELDLDRTSQPMLSIIRKLLHNQPNHLNTIASSLQEITSKLYLQAILTENPGLLNGKMGIAIFLYHYERHTNSSICLTFAHRLIDEIYSQISTHTPIDFPNGLTGIGWGIEYLVQNGFVEANTDEILEDLDNIINEAFKHSAEFNDLFGFGFYYLARLKSRENDNENYKTIHKKKQLVLLTDKLDRLISPAETQENTILGINMFQVNSLAFFILQTAKLDIDPVKRNKLVQYLSDEVAQKMDRLCNNIDLIIFKCLFNKLRDTVPDKTIQDTCNELLKKIHSTPHFNTNNDDSSISNFIKSGWYPMLYGIYYHDAISGKNETSISVSGHHQNLDKLVVSLNKLGLDEGMSGAGLALLEELELQKEILK